MRGGGGWVERLFKAGLEGIDTDKGDERGGGFGRGGGSDEGWGGGVRLVEIWAYASATF
jgi:hypothetical protein